MYKNAIDGGVKKSEGLRVPKLPRTKSEKPLTKKQLQELIGRQPIMPQEPGEEIQEKEYEKKGEKKPEKKPEPKIEIL